MKSTKNTFQTLEQQPTCMFFSPSFFFLFFLPQPPNLPLLSRYLGEIDYIGRADYLDGVADEIANYTDLAPYLVEGNMPYSEWWPLYRMSGTFLFVCLFFAFALFCCYSDFYCYCF